MAASVKRTKEYLLISAVVLAVSFIVMIIGIIALAGMSVPYEPPTQRQEDIILRTADVTGIGNVSYKALYRVGAGYYSTGDFVVRAFTSSDYLVNGKDDQAFLQDLYSVTGGQTDGAEYADSAAMLASRSRMYVINDVLGSEDKSLRTSASVSSDPGDSFTECVLTSSLEGSGGITIGIRKVEGSFATTGEHIRTDFFVDGTWYQGNLTITDASDGTKNFVMAWNSNGVSGGDHEVLILLRSSDGRGTVLTGGDIFVPDLMPLVNNNVQPGSIAQSSSSSWYVLNAGDNNAYVNFVNLSGDIKASIYDAYGNYIASNDIEGSYCEVLRAHAQDVGAIMEETGLSDVSNTFYIKVERGAGNEDLTSAVNYTMIQSKEAAYYSGGYVAVIGEVTGSNTDPVPITGNFADYYGKTIAVQDISNNVINVPFDDLTYIPLNGALDTLDLRFTGTGLDFPEVPQFSPRTCGYGYMSEDVPEAITVSTSPREGVFASVNYELLSGGQTRPVNDGDSFTFAQGENVLSVNVVSFDGVVNTYNIYVLIGDDEGSFCEDTLSLFPVSYGSGLWLLHNLHPSYIFTPFDTGIGFNTTLSNEDSGSRNLANIRTNPSWTDASSPEYDGGGWHRANNATVKYFLDPRNYIDEEHIFSFERLSFNGDVQTIEGVRTMLSGSFMDTATPDYAQIIYNAGQTAGVSPYLIASRIIQEMGYNGESMLSSGTLPGYEGYYNFFNIGSTPDPSVANGALINGARYAMWGARPDEQIIDEYEASILLPWDNVEDAITGGALWIAQSYISVGQDTLYFQKFDVINNNDGLYSHQYAQNVSMAYTEGERYFESYASSGMLDESFEFVIPVYLNLPDTYGQLP